MTCVTLLLGKYRRLLGHGCHTLVSILVQQSASSCSIVSCSNGTEKCCLGKVSLHEENDDKEDLRGKKLAG